MGRLALRGRRLRRNCVKVMGSTWADARSYVILISAGRTFCKAKESYLLYCSKTYLNMRLLKYFMYIKSILFKTFLVNDLTFYIVQEEHFF